MTTPTRNHPDEIVIGLVSISDRASSGLYEDKGIPSLQEWLAGALSSPFRTETRLIQDDAPTITKTLIELVDEAGCDLVLTTGGTGPARRDVTPEATLAAGTKEMPGFGEQMRQISLNFVPTAILSRQVAVGTKFRLICRICSPNPGISFVATASVASGVTSRRAGPVPPVVSTRSHPATSTSSASVAEIVGASSWIRRVSARHGDTSAQASHSCSAGMPLSS